MIKILTKRKVLTAKIVKITKAKETTLVIKFKNKNNTLIGRRRSR